MFTVVFTRHRQTEADMRKHTHEQAKQIVSAGVQPISQANKHTWQTPPCKHTVKQTYTCMHTNNSYDSNKHTIIRSYKHTHQQTHTCVRIGGHRTSKSIVCEANTGIHTIMHTINPASEHTHAIDNEQTSTFNRRRTRTHPQTKKSRQTSTLIHT